MSTETPHDWKALLKAYLEQAQQECHNMTAEEIYTHLNQELDRLSVDVIKHCVVEQPYSIEEIAAELRKIREDPGGVR